jgi:hypothetical protein
LCFVLISFQSIHGAEMANQFKLELAKMKAHAKSGSSRALVQGDNAAGPSGSAGAGPSRSGSTGTGQKRQGLLNFPRSVKPGFCRVPQKKIDQMVFSFLVRGVLPLTRSENCPAFREYTLEALVTGMNVRDDELQKAWDSLDHLVMPSVHTLKNLLREHYLKCKDVVKHVLKQAKYVSTTADGWTSRSKAFLGSTVHWIDPKTLERRSACLGANRIVGSHTHKLLAEKMFALHREFEIMESLVATVTDNASNFAAAFRVFGEDKEATSASATSARSAKADVAVDEDDEEDEEMVEDDNEGASMEFVSIEKTMTTRRKQQGVEGSGGNEGAGRTGPRAHAGDSGASRRAQAADLGAFDGLDHSETDYDYGLALLLG